MQDPNEDTEWNDALRRFGILPAKEEPVDKTEELVLRLQKEQEVKPYENMNLDELKEAEDDFDEEDERAIETHRCQRLAEWKAKQRNIGFGELTEISGDQYVKEVTETGEHVWVVLHLYRPGIPMCTLLNHLLSLLSQKFPETKFLKAIANSCIPNYPDRHLPTIFVYKNAQIHGNFIGEAQCGGKNLKKEELEWMLASVGAVNTDLEENPRKATVDMMTSLIRNCCIQYPDCSDSDTSKSDNDGD
ncbi:phosducin-like protein 2 [Acipenser ruthenus]|uniref:phosducin-like protein 2 n=1 Tax=Acipenser ruthenus TaxID=7906 RepID=UPI00274038D6|nr:phosducin-like protein 2 [Acipenser ruthenus]